MSKDQKDFESKRYSNRFLKKKIEILFDNTFQKNIVNSSRSKNESISQQQKPKETPIKNQRKKKKLKTYFLILIFITLLFTGIFLLRVKISTSLNGLTLDWVYWINKIFVGQQSIAEIYLNKKYVLESGGPIYSTPAIADLNGDRSLDFVFANTLGDVYAIDGASGKKIYQFSSGDSIAASINFVNLKKQKFPATLVGNNNGDFFVLNVQGDYFYDMRKELIQGSLNTKPVVNPKNKDIYLVTKNGGVFCLESNYGFVKWKNEVALHADQVFATPFLLDLNQDGNLDIIVVSLSGNVCALNGKDGTILWLNRLFTRVKSSPMILSLSKSGLVDMFSGNRFLFIAGTRGETYLLSLKTGEVLKKKQLPNDGYIVSTPVQIINPEERRLCFTTQAGEILICSLNASGNLNVLLKKKNRKLLF